MTDAPMLSNERIDELLKQFANVQIKPSEKTVFSIGGRGHYENPVSDVLAFFLTPNEDHGLENMVLLSLLNALGLEEDATLIAAVEREVRTVQGNRLDLLLVSDSWVMAIENKIYHDANNPFTDYKKHLEENYKGKVPHLVLLSPKGDKEGGWKSLDYKDLLSHLEAGLAASMINQPFNKWHVFLRDFILNLKTYTETSMDQKDFDFIESRLVDIYALERVKSAFQEAIKKRGLDKLGEHFPDENFTVHTHTWYGRMVVRFGAPAWAGHITVGIYPQIKAGEGCMVGVYYNKEEGWENGSMLSTFNTIATMKNFQEGKSWDIYHSTKAYANVDEAMDDMVKLTQLIKPI